MTDRRDQRARPIVRGVALGTTLLLLLAGLGWAIDTASPGFVDSSAAGLLGLLALPCYFVSGYFAATDAEDARPMLGVWTGLGVATIGLALSTALVVLGVHPFAGSRLAQARARHRGVAIVGPFLFAPVFAALGATYARQRRRAQV